MFTSPWRPGKGFPFTCSDSTYGCDTRDLHNIDITVDSKKLYATPFEMERRKATTLKEKLADHYQKRDFSVKPSIASQVGMTFFGFMTISLLFESLLILIPAVYKDGWNHPDGVSTTRVLHPVRDGGQLVLHIQRRQKPCQENLQGYSFPKLDRHTPWLENLSSVSAGCAPEISSLCVVWEMHSKEGPSLLFYRVLCWTAKPTNVRRILCVPRLG